MTRPHNPLTRGEKDFLGSVGRHRGAFWITKERITLAREEVGRKLLQNIFIGRSFERDAIHSAAEALGLKQTQVQIKYYQTLADIIEQSIKRGLVRKGNLDGAKKQLARMKNTQEIIFSGLRGEPIKLTSQKLSLSESAVRAIRDNLFADNNELQAEFKAAVPKAEKGSEREATGERKGKARKPAAKPEVEFAKPSEKGLQIADECLRKLEFRLKGARLDQDAARESALSSLITKIALYKKGLLPKEDLEQVFTKALDLKV